MTVDAVAPTIEETLRAEQRTCPQCGYAIANPLTDRCPRCFMSIPRMEVNCGSCSHQGSCEFARLGIVHTD